MRFIAAIAIVVPILTAAYVLSRGPWPESRAQTVAIRAADSLTRVRLDALGGGDARTWGALLRTDALLLTADANRVSGGPDEAVAGVRRELASLSGDRKRPDLRIGRVVVGANRRGRLAWAAAGLEGGRRNPLRLSTAYLFREGTWQVLIEHHSLTPTWDALRSGATARQFPAPAMLPAPAGHDAGRLAKRFRRTLDHFGRMRPDRQAISLGPAGGDAAVGDSAVKAMIADWERRLGRPRLAEGGLSAWAARTSRVGWVAANLEVSPPGWGEVTLPLRLTAVYREQGRNKWSLVLSHLSVVMPHADVQARAMAP